MVRQIREGSLEAPTRHPVDWKSEEFYDETSLFQELERVFDICHGCRRCFSLCNSFPTLFDLVDESDTFEIDGVDHSDYWKVVDNCYLCDLCFMTKCPYVPPHEWNVDFPHLMLRAKIVGHKSGRTRFRDKVITSTDRIGKLASVPVVFNAVNSLNRSGIARKVMEKTLEIHKDADLPSFCSSGVHKRLLKEKSPDIKPKEIDLPIADGAIFEAGVSTTSSKMESPTTRSARGRHTTRRVAIFGTCYGKYNQPEMNSDLVTVFEHNQISMQVVKNDRCCGMPKLELGDIESVEKLKNQNIAQLIELVEDGWDIITPIPSCTLMFRQEIPLLFPDDEDVQVVCDAIFDPFEYLMLLHKRGWLNTNFTNSLGSVVYHAACHQRVQNLGATTKEVLSLLPDIELHFVARCSGHNGTYAIKKEFHDTSLKIARPIVNQVKRRKPDHLTSDCILAATHIANAVGNPDLEPKHPISLIRYAYGI